VTKAPTTSTPTPAIPSLSESYLNFTQTIKTPKTRSNYIQALKYYMHFSRVQDYDELLQTIKDPKDIQRNIIMFIERCKQRNLSFSTIQGYVAGIKHFYEYNDIDLKWRRINAHQPARQKVVDDRAYTHEEIKRMVDIANLRDKAIILTMASSGMRVDAVHPIKMKDLTTIEYNGISLYEIRVYPLSNEEYRGYVTPEGKSAIDDYIRWRKQCGERITDESPLFRKGFDKRDPIAVSSPVSITRSSINFIVVELLDKSGVRPRQRMTEEELKRGIRTKRTNLQMNHGLRKFTISNMIRARIEPNARRLLVGQELSGMDSHYDRREQEELLAEYTKAIDYLVIDDSNKVRLELQTLRVERNSWEALRVEVDNLKALLNKG
jgi:integrase